MEKRPFFWAATAGLGIYHTGGYGRIGVYRVPQYYSMKCYLFIDVYMTIVNACLVLRKVCLKKFESDSRQ